MGRCNPKRYSVGRCNLRVLLCIATIPVSLCGSLQLSVTLGSLQLKRYSVGRCNPSDFLWECVQIVDEAFEDSDEEGEQNGESIASAALADLELLHVMAVQTAHLLAERVTVGTARMSPASSALLEGWCLHSTEGSLSYRPLQPPHAKEPGWSPSASPVGDVTPAGRDYARRWLLSSASDDASTCIPGSSRDVPCVPPPAGSHRGLPPGTELAAGHKPAPPGVDRQQRRQTDGLVAQSGMGTDLDCTIKPSDTTIGAMEGDRKGSEDAIWSDVLPPSSLRRSPASSPANSNLSSPKTSGLSDGSPAVSYAALLESLASTAEHVTPEASTGAPSSKPSTQGLAPRSLATACASHTWRDAVQTFLAVRPLLSSGSSTTSFTTSGRSSQASLSALTPPREVSCMREPFAASDSSGPSPVPFKLDTASKRSAPEHAAEEDPCNDASVGSTPGESTPEMGTQGSLRGPCVSSESFFGNATTQLLLQGSINGVGTQAPQPMRWVRNNTASGLVETGGSRGTALSNLDSPDAWRDKFSEVKVRSNHQRRFSTGSPWRDGLKLPARSPTRSPVTPVTPLRTDAAPFGAAAFNSEDVLKRAAHGLDFARLPAPPSGPSGVKDAKVLGSTSPEARTADTSIYQQLPTWTRSGKLDVKPSLVPDHPDDWAHGHQQGNIAPPSTPLKGVLLYAPATCCTVTAGGGSSRSGGGWTEDIPAPGRPDFLRGSLESSRDPAEVSTEGEDGGDWWSASTSVDFKQVRFVISRSTPKAEDVLI